MTESEGQEDTPSAPPTQTGSPERAWDVSTFEILLTQVWHRRVQCEIANDEFVGVTCDAANVSGEAGPAGEQEFTALVSWRYGDSTSPGIAPLSGSLGLRFSYKGVLPPAGIGYYCQVNAPILAYPYIREMVSHVSTGWKNGPLVLKPLDVPKFTREASQKWIQALVPVTKKEPQDTGRG